MLSQRLNNRNSKNQYPDSIQRSGNSLGDFGNIGSKMEGFQNTLKAHLNMPVLYHYIAN